MFAPEGRAYFAVRPETDLPPQHRRRDHDVSAAQEPSRG
jgi:hypothetical protein